MGGLAVWLAGWLADLRTIMVTIMMAPTPQVWLGFIVPKVMRCISSEKAYQYLSKSIQGTIPAHKVAEMLQVNHGERERRGAKAHNTTVALTVYVYGKACASAISDLGNLLCLFRCPGKRVRAGGFGGLLFRSGEKDLREEIEQGTKRRPVKRKEKERVKGWCKRPIPHGWESESHTGQPVCIMSVCAYIYT